MTICGTMTWKVKSRNMALAGKLTFCFSTWNSRQPSGPHASPLRCPDSQQPCQQALLSGKWSPVCLRGGLSSQSLWLASCAGSQCVSSLSLHGRRGWNVYVWCSIFIKGKKDSSRWVFQAQLPALTGCGCWQGNIHSRFAIFNLPQ